MKTLKISFLSAVVILLFTLNAYSFNENSPTDSPKKATVTGKVMDKNTGESLAGALVVVKGTDIKVYTDLEGNYTINSIEPGNYTIEVTYISYANAQLTDISFTAGKSTLLDISILPN
jgi:hypothetical protein